ncbi:hypothetical protein L7F22_052741 [Adiantum nelumboides]|nr:hypothetical protein [Adiantum nelumboides]
MSGISSNRLGSSERLSPSIQPLTSTGKDSNSTNVGSRPSSSMSSNQPFSMNKASSLSEMTLGQTITPIMDRRARQIQADEGFGAQPSANFRAFGLRDSAVRLDTRDDPPVTGSRSSYGRARAGTLPSSWGQVEGEGQPTGSRLMGIGPIGGDIGSRPRSSQPGTPPDFAGSGEFPRHEVHSGLNSGISSNVGANRPGMLPRQLSAASGLGRSTPPPSLQMNALNPFESSNSHGNGQSNLNEIRNRSSSMTTSFSGLSTTPFGPSIFTSAWSETGLGGSGTRSASQSESNTSRRSSTLASMSAASLAQEGRSSYSYSNPTSYEGDVHTLDYLGLDQDEGKTRSGMNEASLFNVSGLAPLRNRASTLAAMPPGSVNRNRNEYSNDFSEADSRLQDLYNAYTQSATASSGVGLGQGRNRAGTVAALGGPGGRQRLERELVRMATAGNLSNLSSTEVDNLISSIEGLGLGAVPEGVHLYNNAPLEGFPNLNISTPPPLSGRPSPFNTMPSTPTISASSGQNSSMQRENTSSNPNTNQVPSRSLWIGNLNSATTGQELMHAFAPYGAIESLRLLPEKECGFVNFVELADAVQAREDVLGALNAKLGKLGIGPGGTVRIGFGKIDALPSHTGVIGSGGSGNGQNRGSDLTPQQQQQIYDDLMGNQGSSGGMGDMSTPTRALWVGSIANAVTPATLLSVFTPFGPVESARILTHKNCGFVNFERVDDAVRARKMLNGREVLGSEMGTMRIGFAKVPSRNIEQFPAYDGSPEYDDAVQSLSQLKGAKYAAITPEEQIASGGLEHYRSNLIADLLNQQQAQRQHETSTNVSSKQVNVRADSNNNIPKPAVTSSSSSIVPASDKGGVPLPAHMMPQPSISDLQLLMRELSRGELESEVEADVASVSELRPMMTYYMTIPLVSEVSSGRRFETAKLREIRRGIESGQFTMVQCDRLAAEYSDSIVDLASDYIGNTLVQKFFETCSDRMKMQLLHRLAPHLAMVGCHKNGTWAAQKILDCTNSVEQVQLIGQNLRPYIPGLLLDSFGNYVVQCCLPWSSFNDFVFDAMVDRCWEIAQGRFGARSMRACLENHNVSKRQRKRVAIAVILNSVPLATSPNGSILLTWLLETPELSKSFRLLAPRFTPHLTHLCTHKLASGTVLRLATQKAEPEASHMILKALFESDDHASVLEEIIVDQVHGSQFITKVLASPTLSTRQRESYSEQVKLLLHKHQLIGVPAYRRLCEDLGFRSTTLPSNLPNLAGIVTGSHEGMRTSTPQQEMKGYFPASVHPNQGGVPTSSPFTTGNQFSPHRNSPDLHQTRGGMSFHTGQTNQTFPMNQQQVHHQDAAFNPFWNPIQGSFSPPRQDDMARTQGQMSIGRHNF